jgi:acylphosphatase
MIVARRLSIRGRVQGVGFRAFVLREASRHGLRGWVRNRGDGSVEALLIGEDRAVALVAAACGRGPLGARVDDIEASPAQDDGSPGFTPLPTV